MAPYRFAEMHAPGRARARVDVSPRSRAVKCHQRGMEDMPAANHVGHSQQVHHRRVEHGEVSAAAFHPSHHLFVVARADRLEVCAPSSTSMPEPLQAYPLGGIHSRRCGTGFGHDVKGVPPNVPSDFHHVILRRRVAKALQPPFMRCWVDALYGHETPRRVISSPGWDPAECIAQTEEGGRSDRPCLHRQRFWARWSGQVSTTEPRRRLNGRLQADRGGQRRRCP